MQSVRCHSCGHDVGSGVLREKYGGACPHCLGAFALDGLLSSPGPTPVPSGGEFGKFILTDRLGKGGMGEVWKAFDKELKRWVALKFLRGESPQELARFQREARTAAALSHPGIAAIYEVGETNGRHYIAMQYVEGRTLQMHPRKDRKGLARLIRDAARALEHAHRHGVIHRDLKPENLIVEKTETETRVLILDFGLAKRIQGGESLSKSGTVAGTLAYMSPEQARGEKLDERSDVYSLGATLYEVLTGKPPFEGANAYEIMRRIEDQEPVTPRRLNQHIPHDLETITLKCLEKDKERRYGSAKDLADDLDRFLEGDAVMARRASTWYRVKMRLSKRKAVTLTAATAALVISSFLGWWLFVGSPTAAYDRRYAEAMGHWADLLRSVGVGGDPSRIHLKAQKARTLFEKAIEKRNTSHAWVMKGRCLALEGESRKSFAAFERAMALEPEAPEARLELAKGLLSLYQFSRGLPATSSMNGPDSASYLHVPKLPPETDAQSQKRRRAMSLINGLQPDPAQLRLLKGLAAMGREAFAEAAGEFAAYWSEERWDVDVLMLEAHCRFFARDLKGASTVFDKYLDRVRDPRGYSDRGLIAFVLCNFDLAIADFDKAVEIDPTLAGAYSNRGSAKYAKGLVDEAIKDHSKAIELAPEYPPPYRNRASAFSSQGRSVEAIADIETHIRLAPSDPAGYEGRAEIHLESGRFQQAVGDFTLALQLDPTRGGAHVNRAQAQLHLGKYAEAIEDCNAALRLGAGIGIMFGIRGYALVGLDRHREAIPDLDMAIQDKPSRPLFYLPRAEARQFVGRISEALEDFDTAVRLDPKWALAHNCRGAFLCDVMKKYEEAIAAFDAAISIAPEWGVPYSNRGVAKEKLGLQEDAIADHSECIKRTPEFAPAYAYRGKARADQGRHDEAIADFSEVIRLNPTHIDALYRRGSLRHLSGDYAGAIEDYDDVTRIDNTHSLAYGNRGTAKDALGLFEEAVNDYSKAIELDPKDSIHFMNRGSTKGKMGLIDEAIQDFSEAIERNPRNADALSNRGLMYWKKRLFDRALGDLSRALQLNPGLASAYLNRGSILTVVGRHQEAIADLTKALELAPNVQEAYGNRGHARLNIGCEEEALADLNRSIQLQPTWNAHYSRAIALDRLGRHEESMADYRKAIELAPAGWSLRSEVEEHLKAPETEWLFQEALRLGYDKKHRESIDKFRQLVQKWPKSLQAPASAYNLACNYSLLGEKKQALDWLEKAVEWGWKSVEAMASDPDLDSIRDEERYKKVISKYKAGK